MLNRIGPVVMASLIFFFPVAFAQEEEMTIGELQQKVVFLSTMVSELQGIVLEIIQRTEENTKVTQDIVGIIKGNKEIYANNKEKLDVVVQSCDEMVKKNGETLYRCKIKLKDEPASLNEDPKK